MTRRSLVLVAVIILVATGCGRRPPRPAERGGYLAGIMGCTSCHTGFGPTGPALDMIYGGGLELNLNVGTWVTSNISPDDENGIGKWTDAQIIAAIRQGKRPDGSQMDVIMPYPYFAALSDDDAMALVKFLRGARAVPNKIERTPPRAITPPAPRAPMNPAPDRSDRVRFGEYLANAMQCGLCHTPLDAAGNLDLSRAFAGGGLEVFDVPANWSYVGPNLTPHPTSGLGQWTEADIASAIMEMRRPDGSPITGPMQLYYSFWSRMPREDALAVAAYLKSLPPVDRRVASHVTDPSKLPPTTQPTTQPTSQPAPATPAAPAPKTRTPAAPTR